MAIVEKTFRSGEVIIKEGEMGTTLFRLLEGNVGIYSDYGKKEQFRISFLKKPCRLPIRGWGSLSSYPTWDRPRRHGHS